MRLTLMIAMKTAGAVLLAGAMGTLGACAASAETGTPLAAATQHTAAMPHFYVTANAQGAADSILLSVRNSATGSLIASTHVPSGPVGISVTGAADNRTFVVGAATTGDIRTPVYSLWRIHLSATGVPSAPQRIRIVIPLRALPGARTSLVGISLSPDGTRLAVSLERSAPSVDTFNPTGLIEVIDLASGRVRTWTSSAVGSFAGQPSWTGPATVAFAWWRVTFSVFPRVADHIAGIGSFSAALPGGSLPGRLTPVPAAAGLRSLAFGGSSTGLATACVNEAVGGGGRGVVIARFGQIGVASGQFRVMSTQEAAYHDRGTGSALLARCGGVLSVDPSGQHALVYGTGFGRLDTNRFTALPGLVTTGVGASAAW